MWIFGHLVVVVVAAAAVRDDRLEAMRAWACEELPQAFEIVGAGDMGKGLRTTRTLEEGEAIVTIGRDKCLSARDAPDWAIGPKSSRLAARLCIERTRQGGEFAPVVNALGESEAPVSWSSVEADLIAGTRAFRARESLLEEWRQDWVPERCDWADFRWAKSVVASRCYEVDDRVGPVYVPVLDLANHDDHDFCALDIDKVDGRILFSLVATRRLAKGHVVAANYFGGRSVDPVKALDAFGWLERSFVDIAGVTCYSPADLDRLLAKLRSDGHDDPARAALDFVRAAVARLDEGRSSRAAAEVALAPDNPRRSLAAAIVSGEAAVLDLLYAALLEPLEL